MLKPLLTREDIRALGVDVTNTTFQRWEKKDKVTGRPPLLHKIKPETGRSAKVYYRREEVERLLNMRELKLPEAS